MTTVRSIINSAMRETNLIPLGVTATDDQVGEAFVLLTTIVEDVLGNEAGENLIPFPLGQNDINSPSGYPWWANELPGNVFLQTNLRIMCNLDGPGNVNLHPKPHDGARMGVVDVSGNFDEFPLTISGNGRMINGVTEIVLDTAGYKADWTYREDLGNWVIVSPLDLDGDMPWPAAFDTMFIIKLAIRLDPRYGLTINALSLQALKESQTKFSARYSQTTTQVAVENALLYLPSGYRFYGPYFTNGWGDPNAFFNSGFAFGT